ncbi:MAG: hypothetical protein JSU69_05950 [Candidatus Zixiibacteriota bacterium]|nr:MAG: hypothetical protein JSU69_05950 [candidate division Zixibacteria bacterium]
MRKAVGVVLLVIFAASFAVGALVSTSHAGPPPGCEFKCMGGDTYLCCVAPRPPYEMRCYFVHYGC